MHEVSLPLPNSKVYFAGRYSRKKEIAEVAELAKKIGVNVVSTWHDKPDVEIDEAAIEANEMFFLKEALADLDELDTANTLVFFSESPTVGIPRAGRHVEFGYFLKMKRYKLESRIYVIGPIENIFQLFIDEKFADVPTFIYEMSKRIG
jgi:hypothetical protein